ncbi:MAG TPA: efflux RND transporter periplasmic adaptor subunit, partial [Planctomycetota bacterium]
MTTTHKIVAVLILLAAGLAVGRWSAPAATVPAEADGGGAAAEIAPPAAAAPEIWTCSMHPQVRLPGPGQCPICAMDLIRLDDGATSAGPRTLELSENAIALAEIETALVERGIVERRLRLVGKVALDETRVATISAWVPGRIERLYVDSTGIPVRAGDHLLELYSPKLFA